MGRSMTTEYPRNARTEREDGVACWAAHRPDPTNVARAEANAYAYAYANLTRNEDGRINGAQWCAGAAAFAGAAGAVKFEQASPGGWFCSEGSVGGQAGPGAGASTGGVSTDEISSGLGGEFAIHGGAAGNLSVEIHPNDIVDSFTPVHTTSMTRSAMPPGQPAMPGIGWWRGGTSECSPMAARKEWGVLPMGISAGEI